MDDATRAARALRPFPELLLLGAMRAGTTFLHVALSAHPLIVPMRLKEPQFFSLRWAEGPRAYRRDLPWRGPAWAYRMAGGRRPLALDASPYYLFHPSAPARARQLLGDGFKAIAVLREPGQRAWSHYRFAVARGWETASFEDALAAEDTRLAGEAERLARGEERPDAPHQQISYAARGRYAEQVERWRAAAPPGGLLLLKSEDLFADPQGAVNRVFAFLGLPPAPLPANIPLHAVAPAEMSPGRREMLDALFEPSNRRLAEVASIEFGT
ncbi:MAG TPA: sulfotransferase domain-containing protein [Caulobacteraceae bacterium]|jgi:hypothetical protein|nr:sulfotransferase domain-containing protein [Caulobacteraceae bacterium]